MTHTDLPARFLGLAESAAGGQFPVAGLEVVVVAAGDHGGPVTRLIDGGCCLLATGATAAAAVIWLRMASTSALLKLGAPSGTGAEALAGTQHEQVAAHAGNLVGHRAGGAVAEVTMVMTAATPMNDTQDGQNGTHQVAPDGTQGEQQRVPQHQAASPLRRSLATLPSTK